MSEVAGAVEAVSTIVGRHPLVSLFAISATLAFACLAPLEPLAVFQESALCGPALVLAAGCGFLFLAVAASKALEGPICRARYERGLKTVLDGLPANQLRLVREAYEAGGSASVSFMNHDALMLCDLGVATMPRTVYRDPVPMALAPETVSYLRRTEGRCFRRLHQ